MSQVIGDPTHATFGGILEAAGARFAAHSGGLIARSLVILPGLVIRTSPFADFFDTSASSWAWAVPAVITILFYDFSTALVMHHARSGRPGVPPVSLLRTVLVIMTIGMITGGVGLLLPENLLWFSIYTAASVLTFYAYAAAARGCGVVESFVTSCRHVIARPVLTIGLSVVACLLGLLGLLALVVGLIFAVPFVACLQLEAEEQILTAK